LQAVRMMARIEETFGVELPVRAFFEHPTIAELGTLIERGESLCLSWA
jgi:acyl carrier protein